MHSQDDDTRTEVACKQVGIDHLWQIAHDSGDHLMRDVLETIAHAFVARGVDVTERKSA